MDESDFDDDLDTQLVEFGSKTVPQRSASHEASNSSRPSSNARVQRDLFGNAIESYEPVVTTKRTETPTHHEIDYTNLQTYIYPINYEIRDYQFNIIEKAFYNNTLVALPTGLGKTFIAATIILNYFRWFPSAKVIFMAPTKPLVAQQIKACFNIVGLKNEFAILLDKSKRNRLEIWQNNRVFFTTPQVVENDLTSGLVNPKAISLLVIDEAHKAKGNYAYNNVVKFMDRFNTSYRIVALTATPSSTVDGIKEIVDNLSISKIEIRTENSIDIIKYFKNRKIDKIDISFESNEIINQFMSYITEASQDALKIARERALVTISNPLYLNAFQLLEIFKRNLANNSINDGLKWSNFFLLKLLMFISNCMKKLKIYGLKNFIKFFAESFAKFKSKKSTNRILIDFYEDPNVLKMMDLITTLDIDQISSHPKIETMINYLKEFFSNEKYKDSKVIVFSEFRESALEIVNAIEALQNATLKPHIFIGQAAEANPIVSDRPKSSSEDAKLKGMNQKTQKKVIKDFKSGTYNILVATSIGEEGLDIGEVDLIICYDSTSSPIKNIQRLGRTGRKRDGNILMLFADNERKKFEKAMDNYEYIQSYIMKNEKELVQDSPLRRIIPKDYKPQLVKKFIEVENEITNDDEDEILKIATRYMNKRQPATKAKKSSKKSEKIQKQFFLPDNVNTGFQNVSTLVRRTGHIEAVADAMGPRKEHESSDVEMDLVDISTLASDKENMVFKYSNQVSDAEGEANTPKKQLADPVVNSTSHIAPTRPSSVIDMLKNTKRTLGVKRRTKRIKLEDNSSNQVQEAPPLAVSTQTTLNVVAPAEKLEVGPDMADGYDVTKVLAAINNDSPSDLVAAANQKANDTADKSVLDGGGEDSDDNTSFSSFDDGLDGQLMSLKSAETSKLKGQEPPQAFAERISDSEEEEAYLLSKTKSSFCEPQDPVVSNVFNETDGFLTSEQKFDLYTNYYTPGSSTQDFYEPVAFHQAKIGHSKKTLILKQCVEQNMTEKEAESLIHIYKQDTKNA